jgi:hypothetical protein
METTTINQALVQQILSKSNVKNVEQLISELSKFNTIQLTLILDMSDKYEIAY